MDGSKCPNYVPKLSGSKPTECMYYMDQGRTCGLCKRPDMYRCLEELGKKPLPLSHSSIQDFLVCHRLFWMKQVQGLQVKNRHLSRPIKLGALWDAVLQFRLAGTGDPQSVIEEYGIEAVDVETVRALYRAYKDLGIQVEEGFQLQARVDIKWNPFDEVRTWIGNEPVEVHVRGFYDRKYDKYFVENKLSGRPEGYLDVFFVQSQIATYFLADPELEKCVMEVVRTPGLRVSKEEEMDETGREFGRRVYEDVMHRPAYYFMGWNKEKRTYGKVFYRREFDLEDVRSRYLSIFRELHEALTLDGFYRSDRSCRGVLPGMGCDFVNVCRYGSASEEVFEIRKKEVVL